MPRQCWKSTRRGGGRWPAAAMLAVALLACGRATSRPLQLEDLLQQENFGQVRLAPGGRWLLVEQRAPLASASRFDFGDYNTLFRTRIMAADRLSGGPLRPLFPPQAGVGYQAGPISPDGARVAIYRLTPERWELGIATFATGEVRWLGVTPEAPFIRRSLQWISPTRLVAIALAPGSLPHELRVRRPQVALPELWATSARGEASVTVVGSGDWIGARPHASPNQILEISAISGQTESLASGDFVDLELSASRHHLALLEAGEDIRLLAGRPVQGPFGIAVRRMRLRLLDLRTRTLTAPCPTCDVLDTLFSWSPHSDALLTFVRDDGAPWTEGRLIRVEAADGQVTAIGGGIQLALVLRPERVSAGWWGDEPLLFGRPATEGRDDWYRLTARGPVRLTGDLQHPSARNLTVTAQALLVAADGAGWRIDKAGKARKLTSLPFEPLTARFETIPDRTSFGPHPGLRLDGVLGTGRAARAVSLDEGGRETASVAVDAASRVIALDSGGAVVHQASGGGAETLSWRRPGAGDTTLEAINAHLAAVERAEPIAIDHLGPNGEALRSWLFLPARAVGSAPPALVVVPYPGTVYAHPPDRSWDSGLMSSTAVLVGHGYAVLAPSLPTWRAGEGPSDGLADQVTSIIDAAAARPDLAGRFDPTELALWGHSFGAYATVSILAQTNRFHAAVAVAPATDLVSFYGQFTLASRVFPDEGLNTPWSTGWVETTQGDMRAPPWDASERYRKNSPFMQAGRIGTPLMIVYGEVDGLHPGQAEELFSALFRQNKDALLLTYWGESHVFGSPGNLRDFYARGLAFLEAHLAHRDPSRESDAHPPRPEPGSASGAPTTPPPRP
jgi:dipeptidyl aminopeptidase/acylaminoacyl peptidase